MTDRPEREHHPVAFGLLALIGVAVVVGVIAGLVALAGAKVVGLDGGTGTSTGTSSEAEASLFLPKPTQTQAADGPLITLAPDQSPQGSESDEPTEESSPVKPQKAISLQVGQTAVSPMEDIDLTGVYPGGEGAILQVQRFENGAWIDFPVTVSVSNQTFATYVLTGRTGLNRFRVVDTDTGKASNEVKVTIG